MNGGVIITGASSGIGRACALHLDQRGFQVLATVRKQDDALALEHAGSDRLTPLLLDVTDEDAPARLRAAVDEELRDAPLRGVVNNAGIGAGGPLETIDVDELRKTLEVNAIAPIAIAQALIPRLRESRGRVVNMSSIGGRISQPFLGPYSASKYALEALSDALRRELQPWGIHVALIEPGNVKTRIWEKGASMVEEVRASASEDELRLYGRNLDRMERFTRLADRTGAKPERVAKVVEHALTSDRPRVRYLVGPDARVQLALARALPTRVFDRMMGRIAGS
jgi:NAD(P)-dependent dehydrogenase (short-subunit alcohol dehydrogenase family)